MIKIPVGISACLLGDPVRYDGDHQRSAYCVDTLAKYFEFHSHCPEVAIGLGVPRQPIRLVAAAGYWQVQSQAGGDNYAPALAAYAQRVIAQQPQLCGFIVKAKSPSCGLASTKTYNADGVLLHRNGSGAFTYALQQAPQPIPIIEAEQLANTALRSAFIAAAVARYEQLDHSFAHSDTAAALRAL